MADCAPLLLNQLEQTIQQKLFDREMQLYYDYATSPDSAKRFESLPRQEEIQAEIPNPLGWGTGMEDCALHAGNTLDAFCIQAKEVQAAEVLKGLSRLTLHPLRPGFVARGESPFAPGHCYPNSSRDQFTLAVSGAWRAFHTLEGTERQQSGKILEAIAHYCQRNITAQSGDSLLRSDGKRAMWGKMRHAQPHEALRLPMFYAAAGTALADHAFLQAAEAELDTALAQTLTMDDSRNWWDIELSQLQLSITVLQQCAISDRFSERLMRSRRNTAYLARRELTLLLAEFAAAAPDFSGVYMVDWRKCAWSFQKAPAQEGGAEFYNVVFPTRYAQATRLLRGVGNLIAAIAADGPLTEQEYTTILSLLKKSHAVECGCSGLISLYYGLILESYKHRKEVLQ